MRTQLTAASVFSLLYAGATATSLPNCPSTTYCHLDPHTHANDIFNAIHSSMRQFGSSLIHNGMGFYIGAIPQGTEFYHGTPHADRINGTEWLAFEGEHALLFASRGMGRSPPGPGTPGGPGHGPPSPFPKDQQQHQIPLSNAPPEGGRREGPRGFLHTYTTKRLLRVLYLDGQSAAKSSFGTLDTQDLIIRNGSESDPFPGGEYARAEDLCRIARDTWAGRIDGFLRMEGGFELILCSFANALDVADIKEVYAPGILDHYAYYEAIASRYHGIGGGRVTLDYSNFVTMFALPNATYMDEEGRARLFQNSIRIADARELVRSLVLSGKVPAPDEIDWQKIVDMYVSRWSNNLEYLFTLLDDQLTFKQQLSTMLRPYLDLSQRDREAEIGRCRRQYWPRSTNSSSATRSLAAQAVAFVVARLCSDLWTTSAAIEADHFQEAAETAFQLKTYLSWTTWKRCRGCRVHEICKLPIWPMGSKEDFVQPQCSDFSGDDRRGRYWGDFGGPRRLAVA